MPSSNQRRDSAIRAVKKSSRNLRALFLKNSRLHQVFKKPLNPLGSESLYEHLSSWDLLCFKAKLEWSTVHFCDVQEQRIVLSGHEEGLKKKGII
jgi:hypothetical protein